MNEPIERPPFRIDFPEDVRDGDGRLLRPGSSVRVRRGDGDVLGEVVGWSEGRVRVIIDVDLPEVLGIMPAELRTSPQPVANAVTPGALVVHNGEERHLLVAPVGTRDIQPRANVRGGPFPDPRDYLSERPMSLRVDTRLWAEEVLRVISALDDHDAVRMVFDYLDAPVVRRVILEANLPAVLDRLVLVATSQNPSHPDDTAPSAQLLELWLRGAGAALGRSVREVLQTIVLAHSPHLVSAVEIQMVPALRRAAEGCSRISVVAAGGTPAMTYGTLFAAMETGLRTRHIQVPFGQPIVELDFEGIVHRAAVARIDAEGQST